MSIEHRPPQPFEASFDAGVPGGAAPGEPQEPNRPLDAWEMDHLYAIREQLPNMGFSPEQIEMYKETIISPLAAVSETLNASVSKRPMEEFNQIVETMPYPVCVALRQTGHITVNASANGLLNVANRYYHRGDSVTFAATMDVISGMHEAITDLHNVEDAARGNLLERKWNAHIYLSENSDQIYPGLTKEKYLALVQNNLLQSQATLTLDESGFTAIASRVARLQAEARGETPINGIPTILPYQTPELVVAGAELAQIIYQAMFPFQETPHTNST